MSHHGKGDLSTSLVLLSQKQISNALALGRAEGSWHTPKPGSPMNQGISSEVSQDQGFMVLQEKQPMSDKGGSICNPPATV